MDQLKIKEILKAKGLGIKDVADRLGMDASNLNHSLEGNPTLSRLTDVAKAIGCSVSDLFGGATSPQKSRSEDNAYILQGGRVYKMVRATDYVRMPTYFDYSELRHNLRGFVERAQKCEKKGQTGSKEFAMMGMIEYYGLFSLLYIPESAIFYLTLCYRNGKFQTIAYDARCEFCKAKEGAIDWDIELLFDCIRNDIESLSNTVE